MILSVSNQPTSIFSKLDSTGILSNHTAPQFLYNSDKCIPESKVGNEEPNPLKHRKT